MIREPLSFALFVLSVTVLVTGQQNARKPPAVPEITQDCMDCICQGSSNCDTSLRCHNAGQAYFCGPYVISWAYWHDGGRPGDRGRPHDFETCLNNKTCAEQAIRGYMKKHGKDCDQDGVISCYDFASIHKMGPGTCGSASIETTDYWQKFLVCYEGDGSVPNYDYGAGNIDARSHQTG